MHFICTHTILLVINIKREFEKEVRPAKIYRPFLVTIPDPSIKKDRIFEDEEPKISEREHASSSNIGDPRAYLDAKIYELQEKLPHQITAAKLEIEEKLRFTQFKKLTQGWAIVAAGVKDIFGDFVGNDYKITPPEKVYSYGFLFFYGLGFGFPALVSAGFPFPTLPPIDCSVDDYHNTVEKYGLSYGPLPLASQVAISH